MKSVHVLHAMTMLIKTKNSIHETHTHTHNRTDSKLLLTACDDMHANLYDVHQGQLIDAFSGGGLSEDENFQGFVPESPALLSSGP